MYRKVIAVADEKIEFLLTKLDEMELNKKIDIDSFDEGQKHAFLSGNLHGHEEMRQLLFSEQIKANELIKQAEKYQQIEQAWKDGQGEETIFFLRKCKEVIEGVEIPKRKKMP